MIILQVPAELLEYREDHLDYLENGFHEAAPSNQASVYEQSRLQCLVHTQMSEFVFPSCPPS